MAEPAERGPSGELGTGAGVVEELMEIFFVLSILGSVFVSIFIEIRGGSFIEAWLTFFKSLWPWLVRIFKWLSTILSLFFLTGIIYSLIRLTQIKKEINEKYRPPAAAPISFVPTAVVNPRWQRVLDHVNSENPNDWRLAILEADIILEEMLQKMGYRGESVGDKLKTIEASDFTSIDAAWEAHKVRNMIVHQGSDFLITGREAKRVVDLYRQVFEEFRYI